MNIFSLKTILTASIGMVIASSVAVPAKAVELNSNKSSVDGELVLSQIRDSNYNNQPSDDLKNIIGLTGLAIGTGVVGYHLARAYNPSLVNSLPAGSNNAALIDRVNPKLRKELLRLVHNKAIASRLLSGTLTSHPGRSPNWVAEKVIYDLKRGR